MKDYEKQIKEITDKVNADKTFSLDALNQIQELKNSFDFISKELKKAKDAIIGYNEREISLNDDLSIMTAKYDKIKDREKKVDKLVEEQKIKDVENKAMKSERDLVLRMFETVFKNPVVQKSSFKNIPMKDANGYISSATETENETKEINN